MKRNSLVLLIMAFTFMLISYAYAGTLNVANFDALDGKLPVAGFEVTNGISKEVESSFAKTKTFDGKAPKDSTIVITVYGIDNEALASNPDLDPQPLVEKKSVSLTVGSSGMFTQTVDLNIGENYVTIKAVLGNCESVKSTIIKRKDQEIMLKLEQKNIALPGQSLQSTKTPELSAPAKVN